MTKNVPAYVVNAFSRDPDGGNPAAVCLLKESAEDVWMQAAAEYMGLSETAFLFPENGGFRLRWFSPVREVDLCGHATLAAAFFLYTNGKVEAAESIKFMTRSGVLTALIRDGWVELDFPSDEVLPADEPELSRMFRDSLLYTGKARFDILAELKSPEAVKSFEPDLKTIASLPARGLMITSKAAAPYDFVSRFFAPRYGIPEDPVTGSAHCALGPFWEKKLGKKELLARQLSTRGGTLKLTCGKERIQLSGEAVMVRETLLPAAL